MPKFITVPAPVTIHNPITGKPDERSKVVFREFVVNALMGDARWMRTPSDVEAAQEIMEKLKSEEPVLVLERDTWDRLNAVASAPQNGYQGYHGSVLPQVISFIYAVTRASDKAPDVEVPAPKAAPSAQA